jgi:hypothetical protein
MMLLHEFYISLPLFDDIIMPSYPKTLTMKKLIDQHEIFYVPNIIGVSRLRFENAIWKNMPETKPPSLF